MLLQHRFIQFSYQSQIIVKPEGEMFYLPGRRDACTPSQNRTIFFFGTDADAFSHTVFIAETNHQLAAQANEVNVRVQRCS